MNTTEPVYESLREALAAKGITPTYRQPEHNRAMLSIRETITRRELAELQRQHYDVCEPFTKAAVRVLSTVTPRWIVTPDGVTQELDAKTQQMLDEISAMRDQATRGLRERMALPVRD